MLSDVAALEAIRGRVVEAARGTLTDLQSFNETVVDIETRSAAALNTSRRASHVTATDSPLLLLNSLSCCLICK